MVFTGLFSLFATSAAAAFLYLLPVLAYIGYQSQIPDILIGYALGALLFSIAGTALGLYTKRPALYGLIASIVLALLLTLAYRMTGITNYTDLIIGSFASQSFAVFFTALFQYFQAERKKISAAFVSVMVFTLLNIVIFLAMAVVYLDFGQAYLPNLVFYLEALCAVLGLAVILMFLFRRPQAQPS